MILLLGGTGERAADCRGMAQAGYRVLVSLATEVPLQTGDHAGIAVPPRPAG